jgi:hypothetical protein
MINTTRRELLDLIEQLSDACPEYRFGQLVMNLAFLAREDGDRRASDLEDADFLDAARTHLADWKVRHEEAASAARHTSTLAPKSPVQ